MSREAIVDGMTRALWVSAYADYVESLSKQERIAAGTPVSLQGVDWVRDSPETPEAAEKAARELVSLYESENDASMDELVARAAAAEGDVDEEDFGYYLAMMALGVGLSWFDDHARFELKKPLMEAHYDGEFFDWDGRCKTTMMNPYRSGGPPEKGERFPHPPYVVRSRKDGHYWVGFENVARIGQGWSPSLDDAKRLTSAEAFAWWAGMHPDTDVVPLHGSPRPNARSLLAGPGWETARQKLRGAAVGTRKNPAPGGSGPGGSSSTGAWMVRGRDPGGPWELRVRADTREQAINEITDAYRHEITDVFQIPADASLWPTPNPAGLTAKGERMYEKVKASYAGDPRAKEIASRTVLARAKDVPGLKKRARNPALTKRGAIEMFGTIIRQSGIHSLQIAQDFLEEQSLTLFDVSLAGDRRLESVSLAKYPSEAQTWGLFVLRAGGGGAALNYAAVEWAVRPSNRPDTPWHLATWRIFYRTHVWEDERSAENIGANQSDEAIFRAVEHAWYIVKVMKRVGLNLSWESMKKEIEGKGGPPYGSVVEEPRTPPALISQYGRHLHAIGVSF